MQKHIKNNKQTILKLFVYNALMLVFGYLGETKVIPLYVSNTIGFGFFYLAFKLIYDGYAIRSKASKKIFWVLI